MFKREVSKNLTEDYCPILRLDIFGNRSNTNDSTPSREHVPDKTVERSEIFVLAANIYTRARRNPHVRAAGIL